MPVSPASSILCKHFLKLPTKQFQVFYLAALSRYRADSYTSISQLTKYIKNASDFANTLSSSPYTERWEALATDHTKRLETISAASSKVFEDDSFGTGYLCQQLRKIVPADTIFAIEAVTNTVFVADNIQATLPGSWINCGGGGLGWSGGGALGIKLASEIENGKGKGKFVVQIVGDGTFLFSVPGSVYWICQRYGIPVLTIVLNNKGRFLLMEYMRILVAVTNDGTGWHAPKRSLMLVHPDGMFFFFYSSQLNSHS